jgi:signal transduction histidine kinase
MIAKLSRRSVDLAASNRQLKQEIARRKSVEESLRKSEHHYSQLLEQSRHMQEQLRRLSRQLLSAQEEERKKISRELHDVIAQTLTTINVRLAALKKEAALNTKGLERKISRTQQLVEHSVNIVHRFARELRPTVLDDLGLIPALHAFMKSFTKETGIRVSLSAFAAVEEVNGDKRTVLYRVAQEALTNVARHAQASRAKVKIEKLDGAVCMKIKDNGKGFQKERVLHAKKSKRLGLLGMRERLEMVGGNFTVTSAPGKGTAVLARVPLIDRTSGGGGEATLITLAGTKLD